QSLVSGMVKCVLARTRSMISSAQSWYNVCNVSRQPAKSPRRNSASHPAGSFSYSAWKVFRRNSHCATSLLIVSAFCIGCMGGIVILKHGNAFGEHHCEQSKGAALQRGLPRIGRTIPPYAATATLWKVEVTAS